MPELPEVETVKRGLASHLEGRHLVAAKVREPRLRWPVPADLDARVRGQQIHTLIRRGKYLLLQLDAGWLICHLGMSGSLCLVDADAPLRKHDHLDLALEDGRLLRYHDPRRFGAVLWTDDAARHPLIASLGVEPLSDAFDGTALHALCRGRRSAIKQVIMDAHLVVGIGNIYANESLSLAGISPLTPADRLTRPAAARLVSAIKEILRLAIEAGGSTLRDFVDSNGHPGWFQQSYRVYGREGQSCTTCGSTIRKQPLGARATYWCPRCQGR